MKQFLEVLNVIEKNAVKKGIKLHASQLTMDSLCVTLLSTLDTVQTTYNVTAFCAGPVITWVFLTTDMSPIELNV